MEEIKQWIEEIGQWLKEMWGSKVSKGQQIILTILLLVVLFVVSMDAGESIGEAIYNLTHWSW